MRVKLLEPRLVNNKPKAYVRRGRGYFTHAVKGAVMDVSEATGEKWIKDGKAVKTDEALTTEPIPQQGIPEPKAELSDAKKK